jgi:2-dehydropantoate 2-reductase
LPPGVAPWKYNKLLSNLTNAVGALAGSDGDTAEIEAAALREGEAVLRTRASTSSRSLSPRTSAESGPSRPRREARRGALPAGRTAAAIWHMLAAQR